MNSTILTMSFFSLLMLFGIDSSRAEQTQPATISGYSSEEALKRYIDTVSCLLESLRRLL